jgi:hypothetical protein
MLYVLDRIGGGAESYLYKACNGASTAGLVFKHQLNSGEILVFEDDLFMHGATPLEPSLGETARRDVLVCTVDKQETYLTGGSLRGMPDAVCRDADEASGVGGMYAAEEGLTCRS